VDLLEALLLAACFAVIEIPVSSFQIPHFEVTIESLIHVLIRNDPRKENRILSAAYSENDSIFLQWYQSQLRNLESDCFVTALCFNLIKHIE